MRDSVLFNQSWSNFLPDNLKYKKKEKKFNTFFHFFPKGFNEIVNKNKEKNMKPLKVLKKIFSLFFIKFPIKVAIINTI